jgi:hypothetical protein
MAKKKLKLKPTKYPLPLNADRMAKLEAIKKERGFEFLKDAIFYTLDLGFGEKPELSNKNSSSPEVTTSRESDPDYGRYLKDNASFDTSKIVPTKEQPKLPSVFEHFQDNPCHYRAIVKEKNGSFSVYCETKKIPPEVCKRQQERFASVGRPCRPLHKKPRRPRPHTPKYGKPKVEWGDSAGYDPF